MPICVGIGAVLDNGAIYLRGISIQADYYGCRAMLSYLRGRQEIYLELVS